MSKVYLEQPFMNCWSIIDDLQILYENIDSLDEDEVSNTLLGIIELYKLKFDKAYNIYERM